MNNQTQKRGFGTRINRWLAEAPGEIFKEGKWKFWFPTLTGLTALNAVMTSVIFGQDGAQKYIGSIVVLAGAVLCWLALGLLHYSDSEDRLLAIGVAVLDSATLLFVAAHFSFLLWCQGHLWTLRAAETKYRQDVAEYNAQVQPIRESNDRIARSAAEIAQIEKETERLRNDTAYWSRRNGVKQSGSGLKIELSTTKVELPPPPTAPGESSTAFLAKWDWWIRMAGFGELALSIITLIFVRTRTATLNARSNARHPRRYDEEFPDELDADVSVRGNSKERPNFAPKMTTLDDAIDDTRSQQKTTQGNKTTTQTINRAGLRKLREVLKLIAFSNPPGHFKADLRDDYIIIRLMESKRGDEYTTHSTKAALTILDDAVTMSPDAFRARLEEFLKRRGFPLAEATG